MVQILEIEESIHIFKAFCLTLFKRIRQKWNEKDEVSHLYGDTVDKKRKKKGSIVIVKRSNQ